MISLYFNGYRPVKRIREFGGVSGVAPTSYFNRYTCSEPNLYECFHTITMLVKDGWNLTEINAFDKNEKMLFNISKETIDKKPILETVEEIRKEFISKKPFGKDILYHRIVRSLFSINYHLDEYE